MALRCQRSIDRWPRGPDMTSLPNKDGTEAHSPVSLDDGQYGLEFSEENRVLLLSDADGEALVGISGPRSPELLATLAHHHGKPIRFVDIDQSSFASMLGKLHALDTSDADSGTRNDSGFQLDSVQGDAPIVNFINGILIDAIRARASDIHIELFSGYGQVRFRVDGSLTTITTFPADRFSAISARIKIMANLNIMERRLPQDGRVTVDLGHEAVDLRVSVVPIAKGESIVLRLFGKGGAMLTLSELGMDEGMAASAERMLAYPHGLILVTGPTGSGKTTTLNAMLRKLRSDSTKIITIEDPIEYLIDGISQIQTNEQIGLTFDSLLRRVLRQDPNVVMVGEVRDHPTADLVVRAALTGHLVLSTLHTNDSVSAISRLRNIGVEPFLVAAVLRGVIAQRLVRRLCPDCKVESSPKPAERAIAERYGIRLETVYRPTGCNRCRHSGYDGRFAVYEHFLMDEGLESAIVNGDRLSSISEYLGRLGMTSLARAALERVALGETTVEEVEREIEL